MSTVEIDFISYGISDLSIVSIAFIDGKYFIHNERGHTWRVLKSNKRYKTKTKPHKLARGDVLKLGRYIFEVKYISTVQGNKSKSKEHRYSNWIDLVAWKTPKLIISTHLSHLDFHR